MTYDLAAYRHIVKPQIESWIKSRPFAANQLSELAIATGCPVVCVAYLIGEVVGFTPALWVTIRTLEDFYHVKEVKNTLTPGNI